MSARTFSARWTGRAGTIAFVVAALALGRVVGDRFPDPIKALEEPHVVEAQVGEAGELRLARVQVDQVQVGTRYRGSSSLLTTDGVWVMADITLTPTLQDVGLTYAQVRDGQGRIFGPTRGGATNTCRVSQPGIPLTCSVALELPEDAVPGARLLLAPVLDHRFDNVVSVDLALTADDVARAQADPQAEPLTPRDEIAGAGR